MAAQCSRRNATGFRRKSISMATISSWWTSSKPRSPAACRPCCIAAGSRCAARCDFPHLTVLKVMWSWKRAARLFQGLRDADAFGRLETEVLRRQIHAAFVGEGDERAIAFRADDFQALCGKLVRNIDLNFRNRFSQAGGFRGKLGTVAVWSFPRLDVVVLRKVLQSET